MYTISFGNSGCAEPSTASPNPTARNTINSAERPPAVLADKIIGISAGRSRKLGLGRYTLK